MYSVEMSMSHFVQSSHFFHQGWMPSICFCYLFIQVAGAAVIFEVQRNSRSEARKEEVRRQELEVHIDIHKKWFACAEIVTQSLLPAHSFPWEINLIISVEHRKKMLIKKKKISWKMKPKDWGVKIYLICIALCINKIRLGWDRCGDALLIFELLVYFSVVSCAIIGLQLVRNYKHWSYGILNCVNISIHESEFSFALVGVLYLKLLRAVFLFLHLIYCFNLLPLIQK